MIDPKLDKDVKIKLSENYRVDHLLTKALKLVPGVIDAEIF